MFKFTALESLHNNMKLNDMERVVFPFRYNEKGFSCIFITDILPYRLYLSTLGDNPITFELKINNKYETSSYMNDYSKLIEYLELKYDPNHKFKPNDFFRSLNNNIPENCNNAPNYKDVIVIAASHREIEESDKIYFCGWKNNIVRNVTDENLEKTRSAFGDELAELCKKKNISSRWTDIDKDEEINKINDIYTM
ncbi:DUF6037 family protein [Peptoniphilus harei]|uniref:DUF6037 family protein n=1 Tax=Peptoniphilus harei TaxID=54005 RepID=UPI0025507816|nr:DUF6037 family protein [Peptoniphilus harei]MDK7355165.1 DUF6037 family protein [Peptoniphilus harei]MDK7370723.1 DUF6037 family protein [Peptoniphilus harei]